MVEESKVSALQLTEEYPLLTGGEERKVDEKGRVVLPAGHWRDAFAGQGWIGPYKGRSLSLFTRATFLELLAKVDRQEVARVVPDGSVRDLRRMNPAVTIDAQGRLTIPPHLRELRGIEPGATVFIEGQGDRLEIRPIDRAVRKSAEEYDAFIELLDHL